MQREHIGFGLAASVLLLGGAVGAAQASPTVLFSDNFESYNAGSKGNDTTANEPTNPPWSINRNLYGSGNSFSEIAFPVHSLTEGTGTSSNPSNALGYYDTVDDGGGVISTAKFTGVQNGQLSVSFDLFSASGEHHGGQRPVIGLTSGSFVWGAGFYDADSQIYVFGPAGGSLNDRHIKDAYTYDEGVVNHFTVSYNNNTGELSYSNTDSNGVQLLSETANIGAGKIDNGAKFVMRTGNGGGQTTDVSSSNDLLLDNVEVTTVPEPATAGLMLLGLGGLFFARRKYDSPATSPGSVETHS